MAATDPMRHRAAREARRLTTDAADELRAARVGAGLSQRAVAHAAKLSQSHISRVEQARGTPEWLGELAAHCAVLGLRPSIKLYPTGPAVRDAGQLRLLARLRARIHPSWGWQPEAGIGGHGDLRAWDVLLAGPGKIGIDAETRLSDIQALQRRVGGKLRDSSIDRVMLLIAKTRHNLAVSAGSGCGRPVVAGL